MLSSPRSTIGIVLWGVGLAVAGIGAVFVYKTIDPTTSALFPRCLFHDLTGLYCPGCGGQRALHALLNGRLGAALGFNALTVLALPGLAFAFIGKRIWGRRQFREWVGHPWIMTGIAVAVCAFWIVRNIPLDPFTVLAP